MAGEIDIIVTQQALQGIDDITAKLKLAHTEMQEFIRLSLSMNKGFSNISTPSGLSNYSGQTNNEILNLRNKISMISSLNKQRYKEEAKLISDNDKALTYKSQKELEQARNKQSMISSLNKQRSQEEKAILENNKKLNDTYLQLSLRLKQVSRDYQNSILNTGKQSVETRKLKVEFDELTKKVGQADKAINKISSSNSKFSGLTASVGNLMGAFGIATGLSLIVDVGKNIYETTKQLQSLDLALKMVSETQSIYASNTSFISEISEKWGIEIKGLTEQFTQFYVNAKGKLSEDKIKETFEGIAKAGSLMGISIDKQNDAFYAFNQMLSKGTVQAEELKKQLGNALPGAIKAATMAYQELNPNVKVTEQYMLDQMKAGKLISSEMVPEIIKAYQKLYGIENVNNVNTLAAAQNRLSNSWTNFVKTLSESKSGVTSFFSIWLNSLTIALNQTTKLFESAESARTKFLNKTEQNAKLLAKSNLELIKDEEKKKQYSQNKISNLEKELKIQQDIAIESSKSINSIREQNKSATNSSTTNRKVGGLGTIDNERALEILKNPDEFDEKVVRFAKAINTLSKSAEKVKIIKGLIEGYIIEDPLNSSSSGSGEGNDEGKKEKALKQKKDHIDLNFEEAKSLLEIAKAEKERMLNHYDGIANDEQKSYDERIKAREEFSRLKLQILDDESKIEQASILDQSNKDNAENIKWYNEENKKNLYNKSLIGDREFYAKQSEIFTNYKKNEVFIKETYENRKRLVDINFADKWSKLIEDSRDYYAKIEAEKLAVSQKIQAIRLKYAKDMYKDISEDEKRTLAVRQGAFEAYKKLAYEEIEFEKNKKLALVGNDPLKKAVIETEYQNDKQLLDDSLKDKSPEEVAHEKYKDYLRDLQSGELEKALNDIGVSSLKTFLDFDENGQSTFEKLLEGAKGFGEEFALVFQTAGDVAQDLFNLLSNNSLQRIDEMRENLEAEKEIALGFANGNASAIAEIEEQFAEKQRALKRKEFKEKKKQAIFNIAIDTAQALARQLATTPLPLGTGFLLTIAALGAAQIASVASQKVPEFYDGGIHTKGGLLKMNDDPKGNKGSNYREVAVTPDGNVYKPQGKNVYANMPKGTEIFKNYKAFEDMMALNNIDLYSNLFSGGIGNITMQQKSSTGITDGQVDRIVSAVNNKPTSSLVFDNGKFSEHVRRGHSLTISENNRIDGISNIF